MIELLQNDMIIVAIVLAILAIFHIYRLIKGPHVIDRVVAADCIDVIGGFIMVLFGCAMGRSIFIDLGLIVALLGFIGTVLISKYLEGKL